MKALFKETAYIEFWVHLLNVPEYKSIAEKAISVLIQIPITYLREIGFSWLCEIKPCKRNSITHIDSLMRGAVKMGIILRFGMLVDICSSKKIIKDNFLNLLCALSCVNLSADCSAIVFLYSLYQDSFYSSSAVPLIPTGSLLKYYIV